MKEELDVETFSLGTGWMVFMEIFLMMCLGKSYFLKKKQRLYQLIQTVQAVSVAFICKVPARGSLRGYHLLLLCKKKGKHLCQEAENTLH